MKSYRLKNKNLVVPFRAESDGIIGDALLVIDQTHPNYAAWLPYVTDAPPEIEKEFGNVDPQNR